MHVKIQQTVTFKIHALKNTLYSRSIYDRNFPIICKKKITVDNSLDFLTNLVSVTPILDCSFDIDFPPPLSLHVSVA